MIGRHIRHRHNLNLAREHRIRKRDAVLSPLPASETNADVICTQH